MTTLTVSQVNFFLKSLIEGDGRLQNICIVGEISNFTDHYRSGHLYFTLKDDRSVLKAVMFATAAKRLRFHPQDGMKVLVRGRVSVYEASGQYQLYAEYMEPQGVGALSVAFEQLKERLSAEGLFAPEHKRPRPLYPQRIGVITSPTGAAVQDMLSVTARRWPLAEIVFAPVQVQGDAAAAQLTAAVRQLNRQNACDVILIGRGGGSLEDLWAFNDEQLARAIYQSHIPVVSAVGHETDFTICDFVADVRAPTPSAAAELATPDQAEELLRVMSARQELQSVLLRQLSLQREQLDRLAQKTVLLHPATMIQTRRERLATLFGRLMTAGVQQLQERRNTAQQLTAQLQALSPLNVLLRGYAVVQNETGEVVKNSAQLSPGQRIFVQLAEGSVEAEVVTVKGEKKDAGKEKTEL